MVSLIGISHRYPSPVIFTGISQRCLSSVPLTDASQRYNAQHTATKQALPFQNRRRAAKWTLLPPPSERKDWRCCLRGIWSRRTARLVPLSGCALSLLKTSSGLHFHQRIRPFQRGRSGPLLGPIRTHSFGPALGTSAHDPTSYFPAPQATHFLSLGNLVQRPRKEEESKRLHVWPWETPSCK